MGEDISKNTSEKGLVSRLFKNLLQYNNKTYSTLKKWKKTIEQSLHNKRYLNW